MSENERDMKPRWVDPDDGPELTEEMIEAAQVSIGGKVVRPARGRLGPDGIVWDAPPPRKRAGR